ncbi:MAG: T9SS type A sorting domain-containing protein, partial [Melioribacteraceae bacterium]|nr:T9SS type A sorting domain-containing protein [Melioribacteraceae bacterium]
NLEKNGDSFIIHKIFADDSTLNDQSVELVLNNNMSYPMAKNGKNFSVSLPPMQIGESQEIYFTYRKNDNDLVREPAERNYKFTYGDLDIRLNISSEPDNELPNQYRLLQNYPNPFNPITRIDYILPASHDNSNVKLKLYNILGAEVKTLVDQTQSAGTYTVELSSSGLSSGVYFYTLETSGFIQTRKLIILK